MEEITLYGLTTIPEVTPGSDLATLILAAAQREGVAFEDGDILVVTSKVVSKAEGRIVRPKG